MGQPSQFSGAANVRPLGASTATFVLQAALTLGPQSESILTLVVWIVSCSVTGKKLMAKCRMLIQENQELGRQLSQGRVAQLEAELALQKKYSDELKGSQDGKGNISLRWLAADLGIRVKWGPEGLEWKRFRKNYKKKRSPSALYVCWEEVVNDGAMIMYSVDSHAFQR